MKTSAIVVGLAMAFGAQAAVATTYVTVQESAPAVAGSTVDVTAHCPAGYTPVGGGYDMAGINNIQVLTGVNFPGTAAESFSVARVYTPAVVITISRPSDAGDGWRAAGYVNSGVQLYAWARCASLN